MARKLQLHGSFPSKAGDPGKSAYEIALDEGFEGSETEWLVSLRGQPGTSGPAGKSAYTYAQEAGYAGTEEEFAEQLANGSGSSSGGVSSWNDLTDKPFYEESSTVSITWDGDITGRDMGLIGDVPIYKVSDLTPTAEDLVGGTATLKSESGELSSEAIVEITGGLAIGDDALLVVTDTTVIIDETTYTFPSTGVYSRYMELDTDVRQYVSHLTYGDVSITWDGDITGRDTELSVSAPFYKVSDLTPTVEDLIGGIAVITVRADFLPETIHIGDGGLIANEAAIVVHDPETFATGTGYTVPSAGIYLVRLEAGVYVDSLTYGSTVVHHLDQKFLPEPLQFGQVINAVITLLPETTVTLTASTLGNSGPVMWATESGLDVITLEPGIVYDITVNGVTHTHTAVAYNFPASETVTIPYIYIGNFSAFAAATGLEGVEDTGEDYLLMYADMSIINGSESRMYASLVEADSATIKLVKHGFDVTKIDKKYLPDGVPVDGIPAALPNPKPLTFTGGSSVTYDGSSRKTVTIPTFLPNPKALTFTGGADGTYDGSSAVSIEIPEHVQADFSQNDNAKPDYVNNRTHWIDKDRYYVARVQGTSEENELPSVYYVHFGSSSSGYIVFKKYSEEAPELPEPPVYVTGTMEIEGPDGDETITFDRSDITEGDGYWRHTMFIVVTTPGAVVNDVTIADVGIYCRRDIYQLLGGEYYTNKLTFEFHTYNPLDEKFIPDTIARTADIPQSVSSVTATRKDDVDGSGQSGLVLTISTETSDSMEYVYDGKGIDSATAETLEPGSAATATITTPMANSRVLKLGIPRGKSAYEYAQDGGYTETEEEFSTFMAKGGGLPLPASATVGQYIVVSAVDENGVVTATKAVDAPSGQSLPDAEEVAF